jgi:hypothetical protein
MSEIMLNIVDSQRAIHGEVHGSFAAAVAGAASAEPETIEELRTALSRFVKPSSRQPFFSNWPSSACDEPRDSGICIVDLTARLIATQSTYCSPAPAGRLAYSDGTAPTNVWISYHVSDDWLFSQDVEGWRRLAEERRRRRNATPPLDVRRVLYERVIEFIVSECLSAAQSERTEDPVAEIHARWLMAPRDDLRGDSPRDLLLAKREFIDCDLQDRAGQWRLLDECPPGLDSESAAYRFGGFGTHENVLYYELMRYLLQECWSRLVRRRDVDKADEIARLRQLETRWLHTTQCEDLQGHSPAQVI